MSKRISRRQNSELLVHKWWVNLILAFGFLAGAYGFASWAIDSGNLLHYALTVALLAGGVNRAVRGVQYAFDR